MSQAREKGARREQRLLTWYGTAGQALVLVHVGGARNRSIDRELSQKENRESTQRACVRVGERLRARVGVRERACDNAMRRDATRRVHTHM